MHIKESLKVSILVRALRNAFNLSQDNLAKEVGSSRPTINRMETVSEGSPKTDTVGDVLRYFREQGVEVEIKDDELTLRFTKKALETVQTGFKKVL